MVLQIIGAGYGRTGTTSLKIALEELGFGPCYHMIEVLTHPTYPPLWNRLPSNDPRWDTIFKNYKSTVDFPASIFYKQLMEKYPDAKVILSVRSDADSWYDSAHETIYELTNSRTIGFKIFSHLLFFLSIRTAFEMVEKLIWKGTFEGKFGDKNFAKKKYQEHIDDVIRNVPKEKLLIFNVKEGWEPLCKFLNVPVPVSNFPHVNDKAEFKRGIKVVKTAGVLANVALLLLPAFLGYFAYSTFLK